MASETFKIIPNLYKVRRLVNQKCTLPSTRCMSSWMCEKVYFLLTRNRVFMRFGANKHLCLYLIKESTEVWVTFFMVHDTTLAHVGGRVDPEIAILSQDLHLLSSEGSHMPLADILSKYNVIYGLILIPQAVQSSGGFQMVFSCLCRGAVDS